MAQRPKAISIIAGFLFAVTAVAVIVGASLLFPGKLLDWLSQFNQPAIAAFQMLGRFSGVLLLALALGTAAVATGLLHRRNGPGGSRWYCSRSMAVETW
jgi:hypothetical protein